MCLHEPEDPIYGPFSESCFSRADPGFAKTAAEPFVTTPTKPSWLQQNGADEGLNPGKDGFCGPEPPDSAAQLRTEET